MQLVEFRYTPNTEIEGKSDSLLFKGNVSYVPIPGDSIHIGLLLLGTKKVEDQEIGKELLEQIHVNGELYVTDRLVEYDNDGSSTVLLRVDHTGK